MDNIKEGRNDVLPVKNRQLLEKQPQETMPENSKLPANDRGKQNWRYKFSKTRRGKPTQPMPNKYIKETTAVGGRTDHKLNGPDVIHNRGNGPENNAEIRSVKDVQPYEVPTNARSGAHSPLDSDNLVKPISPSKMSIINDSELKNHSFNNHKIGQAYSSETKAVDNQDSIVNYMVNCQVNEFSSIFDELNYEDKVLLLTNYIEVLKKKSDKHPSAVFYCNLCKFYSSTIAVCRSHIKHNSHRCDLKERKLIETVRLIPNPTNNHIKALDKMITENFAKLSMTKFQRETCLKVASEVSAYVGENFPGCSLTLYGSVATYLALKDSNIDLNLRTPSTVNGPMTLAAIAKAMSSNVYFSNVEEDFDEGRPSFHFSHKKTKTKCCICLSKEETLKTSEIISKYQMIDPRFQQLGVIFHKWAKLCKVDNYRNGMWPPHTFPLLLIYYLQQIQPPVLPVLHELKGDPEDDSYLDPSELNGKWEKHNNMSVGELWLGLLKFYAIDYAHSERVVSIRKRAPLKRTVKNWIGKRTAIEDPFCVKRNVSRTIVHNASFKYIMACFRHSYLYYGIPRTARGHLYGYIKPTFPKLEQEKEQVKINCMLSACWRRLLRECKIFHYEELPLVTKGKAGHCSDAGKSEEFDESIPSTFVPDLLGGGIYIVAEEITRNDAVMFANHIKDGLIEYKFVAENGDKAPPTICAICSMDGHPKDLCPEARLPPLQPLPPMTKEFLTHLDNFCNFVYEDYSQKPNDVWKRMEILGQLENYLSAFYPDVQLSLFGSSANGFGFRNSDLDICLTFKANSSGQGIDVTELITKLVFRLRKMPSIRNIVPIPSAKVPIIKFKDIKTQIEGDISLYNTLAQHNTQLLQAYALIDDRVKVLGYVMKTFAKLCDICDASRGSLSSYAYILMVIYFLQQCDPPVVPVLQELTDVFPKPVQIQEGQDVWFFRDLSKLEKVWPDYGKNKLSVGDLWLKLLCFYTEEFDFEKNVISVRKKQVVFKFEKMWFKKPMAIEDPFDIQHNLGGALSRKMKLFIIKSLRKGRHHFGVPISIYPPTMKSWKEYFLNVSCLREGAPPNSGCHLCKKIGHKVRNCPERGANFLKEKRNNDNELREGKNLGYTYQNMNYRRRPPPQGLNRGGQFWPRGPRMVKEKKPMVPAGFLVQPQEHVHPPHPMNMAPHDRYPQQWKQMQRHSALGAPLMMTPTGILAEGMRPSDSARMVSSMPTCAAVERDMTKGNVELNQKSVFRSVDPHGQMYHEPCLSLSQYGKLVGCDDGVRNVAPSEGKKPFSGAIPKVGPVNNFNRPRYGRGRRVARNDNGQNP